MKSNILLPTLILTVISLTVIVTLGIYKFFETDKELRESMNFLEEELRESIDLYEESVEEVKELKKQINDDYLIKSISSNKKEFNGNLQGLDLDIIYTAKIKLINEKLKYSVQFENMSQDKKDYENRLKRIIIDFSDDDFFELLNIDLSKPNKKYFNTDTYFTSGEIELKTEVYDLIRYCGFQTVSITEEEYLSQEQTKNKNLEDWSSFLKKGMLLDEVLKLIGEPDLKRDQNNKKVYTYNFEDFKYDLTFSNENSLVKYNKIEINKTNYFNESKWLRIYKGQSLENVELILGNPNFIEKGDYTFKYVYNYPELENRRGYIIFNFRNEKVSSFHNPFENNNKTK
jgi:outer membrane protein assembly factor BamE (lipoprotein component of BamABCDE complex)